MEETTPLRSNAHSHATFVVGVLGAFATFDETRTRVLRFLGRMFFGRRNLFDPTGVEHGPSGIATFRTMA